MIYSPPNKDSFFTNLSGSITKNEIVYKFKTLQDPIPFNGIAKLYYGNDTYYGDMEINYQAKKVEWRLDFDGHRYNERLEIMHEILEILKHVTSVKRNMDVK